MATVLKFYIRWTLRHKDQDFDSFAVWIVTSMLISPNGSSYSLVPLVIPFFALRRSPVVPGLVLFLICNIPVYRLGDVSVLLQFPRLYLMLIFFLLLLRPLRLAWHMGLWGALTVFFFSLFFIGFRRDTDKSTYFFAKEEHIFINDLSVSDGKLVYSYWDGMGSHPVATGMPVSQWEGLELRDKQIFYKGKQLTSSPDVKKKPLLINGAFVLYLSDKNRGPGFYTLRKLDL
jgi:hypothetical protein